MSGLSPRILEYPIWARWNPRRLLRPLLSSRRVWRVDFHGREQLKRSGIAAYASQTTPMPPSESPALSARFLSFFLEPEEFFFES